jgi:hypothetical protein
VLFREQIREDIRNEVTQGLAQQRSSFLHALEVHNLRGHEKLEASRYIEKIR